jgi:hypothetical protein
LQIVSAANQQKDEAKEAADGHNAAAGAITEGFVDAPGKLSKWLLAKSESGSIPLKKMGVSLRGKPVKNSLFSSN